MPFLAVGDRGGHAGRLRGGVGRAGADAGHARHGGTRRYLSSGRQCRSAACSTCTVRASGRSCVAVSSDGAVANIRRVEAWRVDFRPVADRRRLCGVPRRGTVRRRGPGPRAAPADRALSGSLHCVARADSGIRDFGICAAGASASARSAPATPSPAMSCWASTAGRSRFSTACWSSGRPSRTRRCASNKVDAIIFEAGHPSGLTQEATTRDAGHGWCASPGRRSIGCWQGASYYVASSSRAGCIPAIRRRPDFRVARRAVTSSRQPDALAYGVVKAVFDHLADFRRLHPALATLDIKQMVPSEAVMPIHPGALRYFREAGLAR